jgi:serine/threonine protein phosphatase PrpC
VSDLITHTARLVPYAKRPKQVPSFVIAYSYEPLPNEPGSELGNLYVVMEVLVSGRASEEVSDLIIETIGDQYYNQPNNSADALTHFETSIKAVNRELGDYVNRGNAAWIGKLSTAIAIQVGSEIHVSQTGSAETFLYRSKASTQISAKETHRPSTPSKTFGSIASGQLEPGDRLLLATPALIHQVPLEKLRDIISSTSPNTAISEITDLLKGASIDRIAALIIEITTPELAALKVRSEQPSEIKLGSPETALEMARVVAMPIAQSTLMQSKKVAVVAQEGWHKAKPQAKAAKHLTYKLITGKNRRKTIIISIVVIAILIITTSMHDSSAKANKAEFADYQSQYQLYSQAMIVLESGNRLTAAYDLKNALSNLKALAKKRNVIDNDLRASTISSSEPKNYNALVSLVSEGSDEAESLVRVNPIVVASLSKTSKPQNFELFGGNAYVFDSSDNKLSIVNAQTGKLHFSSAAINQLGNIQATTISSAGDGIFIYTSQPKLWFYQFATDKLTSETITTDQWPKATQIASYGSNIYLLADNKVYKIERDAYSYSAPIGYLNTNPSATGLAVDGSIYVSSSSTLDRYLEGTISSSANAPTSLTQITNLHSTANGSVIVGTSLQKQIISIWLVDGKTLQFNKQISLNGISKVYDATYDPNTNNIYATVNNEIVRFPIQL